MMVFEVMHRDPSRLRAEAREYRALAAELGGSTMRSALEETAASLDKLADEVERDLNFPT